jgi:hypothetical protein
MKTLRSPALPIALLALFLSLGGVSYGVATGFIDSREIKNRTVRELDLRRNTLTGLSIRESKLKKVPAAAKADAAASAETAASAEIAGSAANVKVLGALRVAPSASGPDPDAVRAAATRIPLASKGPLTVYAKCFADDDVGANPHVMGQVYAETTQDGAILKSYSTSLEGNGGADQMLNAGTSEEDRVMTDSASFTNMAGVANATDPDQFGFMVAAPDGSAINGDVSVATKTGSLPGGDGIYGAGPACVFTGYLALG